MINKSTIIAVNNCSKVQINKIYLLLVFPLFIINPTVGLIIATLFLIKSRHKENLLHVFVVLLAIWISLVNLTKEPAGDQLSYLHYFRTAGELELMSWWKEMTAGSMKEPLFYLYTYFSYYLFLSQEKLFFFSLSFLNYIILFEIILCLNKHIGTSFVFAFSGIIVCTFFTQYFALTLHVVRQILGATIVVAAIILRGVDGRPRYLLLIVGVLIHTSLVFLAGLASISWFYKKLEGWQILFCIIVLAGFVILFGVIGQLLLEHSSSSITSYAFSRMKDDASDGSGEVSMGPLVMVLIPMQFICFKLLIFDLPKAHYLYRNNHNFISPFYPITYIFLLLSFFILSMAKAPLIQYRFFMMVYTFMPFILPYLFYKTNILSKFYLTGISVLFFTRFLLIHNIGTFKYATLSEILCNTIFHYL